MNTLLDLMHQVWRRPTPVRPFVSRTAAEPSRGVSESPSDLWAWYQSRCTVADEVKKEK